jgi:hypothetical protein
LILEIMVFVLGAAAAGLLALIVTPAVARAAARRTRTRLEASLPANRAEVAAEKDLLRARHALAQRRLELSIGRLNEKLAARMVEANRQREEISTLTQREAELSAIRGGLERRAAELTTSLERTDHRLSAANAELQLREERLAARNAELAHLRSNVGIRDLLTEEQRLELVARDTTIGNLKDALAELQAAVAATGATRDRLSRDLAAQRQSGVEREEEIRTLDAAKAVLEAERADRMAELDRRAAELADLRAALQAAEADRAQRSVLAEALASLRAENTELRRASGAEWESEREQNLRLRERLNEIAGHVVQMRETFADRTVVEHPNGNGRGNGRSLANGNGVNGNSHANGNGVSNGNATNGNGHANARGKSLNGNGVTNGNGYGNGHDRAPVTAPADRTTDAGEPPADLHEAVSLGARLKALQRTSTRH